MMAIETAAAMYDIESAMMIKRRDITIEAGHYATVGRWPPADRAAGFRRCRRTSAKARSGI